MRKRSGFSSAALLTVALATLPITADTVNINTDTDPASWTRAPNAGTGADQVFGGLYGAIIVEDPHPVPVSRDRVMVISDISLNSDGSVAAVSAMEKMMGREGSLVLVNGQLNPRLSAKPAERERWRIINACTSRYLKLCLDGQRQ